MTIPFAQLVIRHIQQPEYNAMFRRKLFVATEYLRLLEITSDQVGSYQAGEVPVRGEVSLVP